MKKLVALFILCVLLVGLIAPTTASARAWHAGAHIGHAWWWPAALAGGLLFGAAIAASYPWYPPAVVYAPTQVVSAPAPVYTVPPAPPAIQREVVYPHGRYVLLGDGVTQAYRWVWVPAPPSGPPPGLPPSR